VHFQEDTQSEILRCAQDDTRGEFFRSLLSHGSIHPTGWFATAILHSESQPRHWAARNASSGGELNRRLDPFPKQFSEHLLFPPLLFSNYPVTDASDLCLNLW
jgi:hypothetical protein